MKTVLPLAMERNNNKNTTWKDDGQLLDTVWVPNRNGTFLNIGASIAEANNAEVIIFGANLEEAEHFPDNTKQYRDSINKSLFYSTRNHVEVVAPVEDINKKEILIEGLKINSPLHLVWSCYEDNEHHCGKCPSCKRLKTAISGVKKETAESVPINFKNNTN